MTRKIGVGKDVQHIEASVTVRVSSTAFPIFPLTTTSMKGFHSLEVLSLLGGNKSRDTLKENKQTSKQKQHLNLMCLQSLQRPGQQSAGLPCSKYWKMLSLHPLQCPATSLQTFSPHSLCRGKAQGQPLKWWRLNSGLVSTGAIDQRAI